MERKVDTGKNTGYTMTAVRNKKLKASKDVHVKKNWDKEMWSCQASKKKGHSACRGTSMLLRINQTPNQGSFFFT